MRRIQVKDIKINRPTNYRELMQAHRGYGSSKDEDGLNLRQRKFVEYYMETGNPGEAYKMAGGIDYQDQQVTNLRASNMLKNPYVKEAVKKRQQHFQNKMEISQERVLQEYACIAFSKLTDYYDVTENDVIIKKPTELTPEQQAAIADISIFENVVSGTRRVAKVKLHDKTEALKSLSKFLGLFEKDNKQRSNVNIKIDEILSGLPPEIANAVRNKIVNEIKPIGSYNMDNRTIN